jgi:hypothetical protein
MAFKCVLVDTVLTLAHRSMQLQSITPTEILPKCFLKGQEPVLEGLSEYIILDNNTFIYRYDKGEFSGAWGSTAADDLDSLILGYYTGRIEGDIAHYPNALTSKEFGDFTVDNYQQWGIEQSKIGLRLSAKLDAYLGSVLYKCLRLIFKIA